VAILEVSNRRALFVGPAPASLSARPPARLSRARRVWPVPGLAAALDLTTKLCHSIYSHNIHHHLGAALDSPLSPPTSCTLELDPHPVPSIPQPPLSKGSSRCLHVNTIAAAPQERVWTARTREHRRSLCPADFDTSTHVFGARVLSANTPDGRCCTCENLC
jgi:hypothetical protein